MIYVYVTGQKCSFSMCKWTSRVIKLCYYYYRIKGALKVMVFILGAITLFDHLMLQSQTVIMKIFKSEVEPDKISPLAQKIQSFFGVLL